MRRVIAALAALSMLSGALSSGAFGATTADTRVAVKVSPPGQISVATVNARQNKILGLKKFEAMLELARAFRFRPAAFNGGTRGGVIAPDVLIISEFREFAYIEIFARLMRLKFDEPYELVGPTDAGRSVAVQAAVVVNTATVTLQREVEIVDDICLNDETSDKPRLRREYPMAALKENETGALFTVVGVHLARDYSPSGESDCLARNVAEIRTRLENEPGATFVAGDFNFRPTEMPYECDPEETGAPTRWWSVMTGDGQGRAYVDAVRDYHRARSLAMVDEWTYQHPSSVVTCDGSSKVRRSRIDYIFASSAVVAEAHADHPGWADPSNFQYSDHRYVLGRFVLSGPPRPGRAIAVQDAGGVIDLTWEPVEGATGWIVYRALAGFDYQSIATLSGEIVTFKDSDTEHDVTYRYAVAPVGVDTGQGVESPPVWALADARGPHVTGIIPGPGAVKVDPQVTIRASFDEWVEATSVTENTIAIYRNGNRIPGRLIRKGGFVLKFDPDFALKKGETFTIVVRPVTDTLGNAGPVFKSRFSTVEPPKKRRHRRR